MRNLKKVLSLALSLVMLLGLMMVGAGAVDTGFKDDAVIDDSYKTAAAINKALGLMTGDGTSLNPKGTITRAEAFILSMRVDNSNDNEIAQKWPVSEKPFNDVGAGKWYASYLTYGKEMEMIAGSNGNYNPDAPASVIEYASLLLGRMGFDRSNYKGDGWDANILRDALSVKMFDGLGSINYKTHTLTRQEACQMAFNAITYTDKAQETGNYIIRISNEETVNSGLDGMVCSSRSEAAMMVTLFNMSKEEAKQAKATYEAEKDNSGSLAKEKFGLTSKSDVDAFGNTCTVWSVGDDEIVSVPSGATQSYTGKVKAAKIFADLGKPTGSVTLIEDGKSGKAPNLSATSEDEVGAAGATINVYKTGNDVKIVVVNTYVGTVEKVTEAKDDVKRSVTIKQGVEGTALAFTTESFEKDDVVLYTKSSSADGKTWTVASAELATEVTGKLEKITNTNEKWTVDGKDYVASAKNVSVAAGLPAEKLGQEVSFYTDGQDNIIMMKGAAKLPTNFMYVLASSDAKENTDYVIGTGKVVEVYAVLADGTVDRFTVNKLGTNDKLEDALTKNKVPDGLYTYTTSNGYVQLTAVESTVPQAAISVNSPTVTVGTKASEDDDAKKISLALNSSTVFVFIEPTGVGSTVKETVVRTGIANIGDEIKGDIAAVGYTAKKDAAVVVFVERAFNTAAEGKNVVYVTKTTKVETTSGIEYSVDVITAGGEEEAYTYLGNENVPEAGDLWNASEDGVLVSELDPAKITEGDITKKVGNNVTITPKAGKAVSALITDNTKVADVSGNGIVELAKGQTVMAIIDKNNVITAFVTAVKEEGTETEKSTDATATATAKNTYAAAGSAADIDAKSVVVGAADKGKATITVTAPASPAANDTVEVTVTPATKATIDGKTDAVKVTFKLNDQNAWAVTEAGKDKITVTAEDGTTTIEYTITVKTSEATKSTDATATATAKNTYAAAGSAADIDAKSVVVGAADKGKATITVTAPASPAANDIVEVTVTPATKATIDGKTDAVKVTFKLNDQNAWAVTEAGKDKITVTAEDGTTTIEYTITVKTSEATKSTDATATATAKNTYAAAGSAADIDAKSVVVGAADKGKATITVTAPASPAANDTVEVTVTPATKATIDGKTDAVKVTFKLNDQNAWAVTEAGKDKITVTAEDGTTTIEYTITVKTSEATKSTDATATATAKNTYAAAGSAADIDAKSVVVGAADKGKATITVTAPASPAANDTVEVTVTPATKATIDGKTDAVKVTFKLNDQNAWAVTEAGKDKITVTAEDGTTTIEYTITVETAQ